MRLIDADALNIDDWELLHEAVCGVFYAPTIEAKPVVHGEWEPSPHLFGYVRCSECHDCNVWGEWIDGKKWNYCPHCGADMRERRTDADN